MPSELLAGHAANFDFWTDEVAHCLSAIDSYEERFQRMLIAQQLRMQTEQDPQPTAALPFIIPRRSVPRPGRIAEPMRNYVRSELCVTFRAFAVACYHNAHLGADVIHASCQRLSIDLDEGDVPRPS